MSKIISIFNQKGGIGKSTTTINLGAALVKQGKTVLLVDMDPQANTTVGVGIDDEELEYTVYDLLIDKKVKKESILEIIQKTPYEGLEVIPSDITLSNAEITLSNAMSRETILNRILGEIKQNYDYILIDCPPSLGLLSINALVASDGIIVPVATSFFSMKGIKHLIDTITLVQDNLKPELQIIGILINMFDKRKNIAKDLKEQLEEVFGDKVFHTAIRINSQIEYAQDSKTPIIYFDEKCNGYEDYMNLSQEVLKYEW
ncbi:ParA family protein [Anaerophilus nitritogenes]|uniref:ParA family protein n=1 Tax=Anaerophilus nitritogenes TaxID=2498136 RepID=UPI00101DFD31|nr:AAA family ATPase [Anaerophilus nitritogenes]